MPENWGRPTWPIDNQPEPKPDATFWITFAILIGACLGVLAWKIWGPR